MSLINQASLITTPNAVKEGKLYSIIPSNGNGDLTITRATVATKVNSLGLIENVAANVPRLNYDVAGGCPSVLLEPQRTNLVTYSEIFSDAIWLKNATTLTPNTVASPDGTIDADTLSGDGTNPAHTVIQQATLSNGITYTTSIYAKKNTNNFLQIIGTASVYTSTTVFANFDLNNGVLGSVGAGATATITNVGNGWYRCTMTATATATALGSAFILNLITSATSLRGESSTLSTSVHIWGAQLEVGAYATSYIPTIASTVTINADVVNKSGISDLINSQEGTFFIESAASANNLEIRIIALSNGTSSTRLAMGYNGFSNGLFFNLNVGGVESFSYQNTLYDITQFIKMAVSYKLNEFKIFINGVKVFEDLSGNVPAENTFNRLGFDNGGGLVPYFGKLKQMQLYKKALTEVEMTTLTNL